MDYQHERHNAHLVYHMICCPKRRRKILVGSVKTRLEQLLREFAQEHGWTVLELAIQPDHVHLFLRGDPYTAPSAIARLMKGRSSRVLREEVPELLKLASLWTRSFFSVHSGERESGDY
jgi:putative transposase